jgi:hypothetical protein
VNPLPSAGTITGGTSVCETHTLALSNSVTGGAWTSSSGNATVSGTGVVTGVTAGTATISYTVTNSCGSASATSIITIVPLSTCPTFILPVGPANSISVYPNPVTDELHIGGDGLTGYSIRNIVGRTILSGTLVYGENSIVLHSVPPGVYLVEIISANGEKVVRKIVKE